MAEAKIYPFTSKHNNHRNVACIRNKPSLSRLALHSDYMVRLAVACNPYSPVKARERLAKDLYPEVRLAVAQSVFTPDRILKKLTKDKDPEVRSWAKKTLQEKQEDIENDPA